MNINVLIVDLFYLLLIWNFIKQHVQYNKDKVKAKVKWK